MSKHGRDQRRKEADKRLAEFNSKYPTPASKLAALPATGCSRQRARYEKQSNQ